ncbi:CBS domain-containing protein [Thermodesulfobacteriota bacterium]
MYEFTYYRARDVMTANPITITGDIRLAEVEAIFEKHDFNGLPVERAAPGHAIEARPVKGLCIYR